MDNLCYAMAPPPREGEGKQGGGTMFASFIPLILMVLIFWFLLIRPQQRKAKRHQELVKGIKKGDDVITSSGMHGKVVGLTDTVVTLEIADKVRIRYEKSQISTIKGKGEAQDNVRKKT